MNDDRDIERALSDLRWCIPAEVDAKILHDAGKAMDAQSASQKAGPPVHGSASEPANGSVVNGMMVAPADV